MGIMTAITSTTTVITTKTNMTGTSTAPTARAGGKSLRRFAPFFLKKTTDHKNVDNRRPLTENVVPSPDPESRFYAVSLKSLLKWPNVKSTPIEVPGAQTAKGRKVLE